MCSVCFSRNSFQSLHYRQEGQQPAHHCLLPELNRLLRSNESDFSLLGALVISSLRWFEKAFLLNDTCFYFLLYSWWSKMISGVRFGGKKIIFVRPIYICCNKEDTEIQHSWQECCYLKMDKMEIRTSIHSIKDSIPSHKSCAAFCLVVLCKERTNCAETQDGWDTKRSLLIFSPPAAEISIAQQTIINT